MNVLNRWIVRAFVVIALLSLVTACGLKRKQYENPITKDTQQPDKVLFDKAINDIEHGRYEIARLTLQTLMNTYDTSEYLAKAKLMYADSWYREGGVHGLAQAEAEYKDFILFYPTMEESAEAQEKVCMIHYKQMEKADRDMRTPCAPRTSAATCWCSSRTASSLRKRSRGCARFRKCWPRANSNAAISTITRAATRRPPRLQALVNHYPLYSKADEANLLLAESYSKMGPRFRQKAGEAYAPHRARVSAESPGSARRRRSCNGWKCRSPKWTRWPTLA